MESELHILFVEDQEAHQRILSNILQSYNFIKSFVGVKNTIEAQLKLKDQYFNAIIMDYQLSDNITGLDALKIFREDGYLLPAIILTGNEHDVPVGIASGLGVLEVIGKFGYYEDGAMDQALEKLRKRSIYLDFQRAGGVFVPVLSDGIFLQLPAVDIILIETKLRGRTIYTETGSYSTDHYINVYANYLKPYNFHYASRHHLVNLKLVKEVRDRHVIFKENMHNLPAIKVTQKGFLETWDDFQPFR